MSLSVLILGGSGFVGRALCEQLTRRLGADARITVPTRRMPHARELQALPNVTVAQADVFRDLPALVQRQHAVVNLVAILQGSAAAFEHVHVELPRRIAAAGVRRLVHVSALGVAEHAPSRYLRPFGRTPGRRPCRRIQRIRSAASSMPRPAARPT